MYQELTRDDVDTCIILSNRRVKNPRKPYTCEACREPITGEHSYVFVRMDDGTTLSQRTHIACPTPRLCIDCMTPIESGSYCQRCLDWAEGIAHPQY